MRDGTRRLMYTTEPLPQHNFDIVDDYFDAQVDVPEILQYVSFRAAAPALAVTLDACTAEHIPRH